MAGGSNYGKKGTAVMWIGIAFLMLVILIIYVYKMNFVDINAVG